MLLLAIDTSGRNGSLALARRETTEDFEILELLPLGGRMYSAELIPQLKLGLNRHQLTKNDIDGFAVVSGPGSFTGLRIGLSTIKALADVLQKPIAAVSILQAAARITGAHGRVIVALDAGRGQLFVGDYKINPDLTVSSAGESLISLNDFPRAVHEEPVYVASSDRVVLEGARQKGLACHEIPAPQADTVARLGLEQIMRGEIVTPETLAPNYIHPSDAVIPLPKLSVMNVPGEQRTTYAVRPATPADIASIRRIEAESPTAAHWPEAEYSGIFEPGAVPRILLVIEYQDHVAGFIVARSIRSEWELENIATEPSSQKKGFGRALIENLLQLARRHAAARIFLEVRDSNRSARELYSQVGFRKTGRRPSYYSHPVEDAITYEIVIEM